MLRLTALELVGFKSFADRTRLEFPDGIAAVIGPNGCGKSNLADAIGFVLGIQTAKDLRGQKMEDFIFGGTRKRKASGLAEVTVQFRRTGDVPLHLEGVELDGETLEITHKLYRSGESIYLVNQRRCRLMDIHRFLEEAGLGFSGYAMIAQGKIESFLGARPLERRGLLEEAARISGYKARRRNAELKLELAQQNLLRVNDILVEVERQLRSLRRQAAKTRQYRKLKEEFRRIQRIRLRFEADRIGERLRQVLASLGQVRTAEEEAQRQVLSREADSHRLAEARIALETAVQQLQEQASALTLQLDRASNAIRFSEEQLRQIQESQAAERLEREKLQDSLGLHCAERDKYAQELDALGVEESAIGELQQVVQEQVAAARQGLEAVESGLEDNRSRLIGVAAEVAALRNQSDQVRQRLQRLDSDLRRVREQRSGLEVSLQSLQSRLAERRSAVESSRGTLEQAKGRLERLKADVESRSRELVELRDQETALHHQAVALRERLQSLQELEISRAQYSEGVKKVLTHLNRNRTVQTAGTLADAVETAPEFERLVEEFLDEELECILVDSLDEAVRGVAEVRSLKSGKCAFMSLVSTNGFGKPARQANGAPLPGPDQGVYGRLGALLQMKPDIQAAFARVFPQQAAAIVVADLDRAMHLAHIHPDSTFLTLDGESLQPRGLVAATAVGSTKLGLLGLKRQLRELEGKAQAQQAAASAAQEIRLAREEQLRETRLQLERCQESVSQLERDWLGQTHALEQDEADHRRQAREHQVLESDERQFAVEFAELTARLESMGGDLSRQEAQQAAIETELKVGRERALAGRERLAAAQNELNGVISRRRLLEERRQSLSSTLQRIRQQIEDLESRIRVSVRRQESSELRTQELNTELSRFREESRAASAALQEQTQDLIQARQQLRLHRQESADVESALEELRRRLSVVRSQGGELEVERARLETQLQHLEEHCQEQLRATLDEALLAVQTQGEDPGEIDRRYEQLRRRLEAFGPVNMTALKEYQEAEERHGFLSGQRNDLEKSIADTTLAIQELNRRSRAQFTETFNQVNRNFQDVFKKLFNGGECGMQLLDEDDVLECGIDIYAQPPGKKLQNVMLLSGGEKALTVFALLVAIFMYRPSRFCVLDEVDAPLDDANVQRFAHLIRDMSEQTQFIVVTHNKRTMEHAHAMYGVTMEEPGISKVVSAKF